MFSVFALLALDLKLFHAFFVNPPFPPTNFVMYIVFIVLQTLFNATSPPGPNKCL